MSDTTMAESILFRRFDDADHKTFAGRGGMQFTYVADEQVMARLDEAFGIGNWCYNVADVGGGVCKGRLGIRFDDTSDWIWYEDFGYPTNGHEPLKEASGDALRRIGRYLGIARYVYEGKAPAKRGPSPAPAPVQLQSATGAEPPWPAEASPEVGGEVVVSPLGTCPDHGVPWRGKPGDLWHGPKPFCRPAGQRIAPRSERVASNSGGA